MRSGLAGVLEATRKVSMPANVRSKVVQICVLCSARTGRMSGKMSDVNRFGISVDAVGGNAKVRCGRGCGGCGERPG